MADLQYFNYPGYGDYARKELGYSQAVRVGDRIECSGQGGWKPETFTYDADLDAHIEQAFKNVDAALKSAGGKGWSQVYRVNTYHVPVSFEAAVATKKALQRWMPDHMPIWTAVGVTQLVFKEMQIEIEVCAYDEEGAKKAREEKK